MAYLYILIGIISITYLYIRLRKNGKYKFPPGPSGIPIIGNIHQLLAKNPYEKLSEWSYKYGKMYTIHFGTIPAVVINDPILLQKIFSSTQSTGKFQTDAILCMSQGPYGILGTEGQCWNEQRRFCLKTLNKFGFGKSRMENSIILECQSVCDWIIKSNAELKVGESEVLLKMLPIFTKSTINNIWSLVTESKIKLDDSDMYSIMKTFNDTLAYTVKSGLCFLPWLKYIIPGLSSYTAYDKACVDRHKFVQKEFDEHKKSFSVGVSRDLIDEYIKVYGDSSAKMKHAIAAVVDLFIAGFETTGATLTWLFYYLSQHQDLQRKFQEEIDKVIGQDEEPSFDHRPKMPFFEAFILETLRMSSIAPMATLHRLLDDLEVDGYKFPKHILPVANLYHCHYNKNVWGDPNVFRPERFFGSEGKRLKEHMVPFSVGKRQCLGQHLAMDIFFIYATKMFQQFDVMPNMNENREEYFKPDVGFLLIPQSLGLVIKQRLR